MLALLIPVAWAVLALLLRQPIGGKRLALVFAAVAVGAWAVIAAGALSLIHHYTRTPLLIWWAATDALLLVALETALPPMQLWRPGVRAELWGINEYATAGLMALAGLLMLAAGIYAVSHYAAASFAGAVAFRSVIQSQFAILSRGARWTPFISDFAALITMIGISALVAVADGGPAAQALAAVLVVLNPQFFLSPSRADNTCIAALSITAAAIIAMQVFRARRFAAPHGIGLLLILLLAVFNYPTDVLARPSLGIAGMSFILLVPVMALFARRELNAALLGYFFTVPYILLVIFLITTRGRDPRFLAFVCLLCAPAAILMMTRAMRLPAVIILAGLAVNLSLALYPLTR